MEKVYDAFVTPISGCCRGEFDAKATALAFASLLLALPGFIFSSLGFEVDALDTLAGTIDETIGVVDEFSAEFVNIADGLSDVVHDLAWMSMSKGHQAASTQIQAAWRGFHTRRRVHHWSRVNAVASTSARGVTDVASTFARGVAAVASTSARETRVNGQRANGNKESSPKSAAYSWLTEAESPSTRGTSHSAQLDDGWNYSKYVPEVSLASPVKTISALAIYPLEVPLYVLGDSTAALASSIPAMDEQTVSSPESTKRRTRTTTPNGVGERRRRRRSSKKRSKEESDDDVGEGDGIDRLRI